MNTLFTKVNEPNLVVKIFQGILTKMNFCQNDVFPDGLFRNYLKEYLVYPLADLYKSYQ